MSTTSCPAQDVGSVLLSPIHVHWTGFVEMFNSQKSSDSQDSSWHQRPGPQRARDCRCYRSSSWPAHRPTRDSCRLRDFLIPHILRARPPSWLALDKLPIEIQWRANKDQRCCSRPIQAHSFEEGANSQRSLNSHSSKGWGQCRHTPRRTRDCRCYRSNSWPLHALGGHSRKPALPMCRTLPGSVHPSEEMLPTVSLPPIHAHSLLEGLNSQMSLSRPSLPTEIEASAPKEPEITVAICRARSVPPVAREVSGSRRA